MDSDSGSGDDFVGEATWVLVPTYEYFQPAKFNVLFFILIMLN